MSRTPVKMAIGAERQIRTDPTRRLSYTMKKGYTKKKVLTHVKGLAVFLRDARYMDGSRANDEQLGYWAWNDWFFLEFR